MGDAESALPATKKRAAGRQITQLDPEPDDDGPEPEMGTFQKASEEVLASRRIVKVRRHQPPSAPSSNPFAGIRFVPPTDSSASDKVLEEQGERTGEGKGTESGALISEPKGTEQNKELEQLADVTDLSAAKVDDKVKSDAATQSVEAGEEVENGGKETEAEARKEAGEGDREKPTMETVQETENGAGKETKEAVSDVAEKGKRVNDLKDTADPAAPFSSFQQLCSSQNAFTGLAGTGFSTSSFSFGSIAKEGSTFGASSGSLFGSKNEKPSYPSFGIGSSNNGTSSLLSFGTTAAASESTKTMGVSSMQEMPIETGEENEKVLFNADAVLYEYLDGGWKERGKGELKVNIPISGSEKARLVMRARGNYRLILNASLYPELSLTSMDKRGITFACVNSAGEGKNELTTIALKFRDGTVVEEFREVVTAHKGKKSAAAVLKTPENSPKASDD